MKHYKHPESSEVFAYESEQERQEWGAPELVEMTPEEVEAHLNPPIPSLTREQIEALRLRAYADPLTGSDRYFVEASRLQEMGAAQEEIDVAKAAGANRYAEIQNAYPWPA
ncbi:hypothetical protein ACVQEB_003976 [Pseudomonas aeruginosa]|nr:hypothetical protein [Pseudomonas aeruginosa]